MPGTSEPRHSGYWPLEKRKRKKRAFARVVINVTNSYLILSDVGRILITGPTYTIYCPH